MLGCLMYQTRPPDETIVLVSGVSVAQVLDLREDFSHASVLHRPNLNDWGHEKRAEGLARASKDWVGFFNDDDWYDDRYLEKMLGAAHPNTSAVYCGWSMFNRPQFCLGSSTSGNYIVRRELGQRLGYMSRSYEADGHFIDAIRNSGAGTSFVDEVLYAHNWQP